MRFGPLRSEPPAAVLAMLPGAEPGTSWTATRIGDERGYPNGGLWRVEADQRRPGPAAVYVKRTGPVHLGTFRVWRLRADPADPQWWGREAAFYESELATTGWTDDVRAARCVIDDHGSCRDLWIEEVAGIPAALDLCRRAAVGLAHWQVAHAAADHHWLADEWIATHVGRYELDNARTLAHPAWPAAIERGLDPALRELVATRVTDPAEIARRLAEFPLALTNHDFHTGNLGTVGDQVVIIDWAYVGRGPIGHDVGHLALSLEPVGTFDPAEVWRDLTSAYAEALGAAGWHGDPGVVERSIAVSNRLRLSWTIDTLLDAVELISDEDLAARSRLLTFLGRLH